MTHPRHHFVGLIHTAVKDAINVELCHSYFQLFVEFVVRNGSADAAPAPDCCA